MNFNFKTAPYQHQIAAFNKMKDRDYFALFADMGTGKTKITLDVAAYRFCDSVFSSLKKERTIDALMVIAPNHVHEQWIADEAPKHCAVPYKSFTWKSSQIGRVIFKRQFDYFSQTGFDNFLKIFAVNIEAFQSNSVEEYIADFVHNNRCLIVIDEATRIKHDSAKRTKLIHKLEKYGFRAILTGTPTAKSPFDLWSQMEFLKKNYFNCNYFIYQHRYGIMMRGTNPYSGSKFSSIIDEGTYAKTVAKINKMIEERNGTLMPDDYDMIATTMGISEKNIRFMETHPTYTRFKRLEELRDYIKDDVFAIKKEDCLDLPPKIYEKIFVTMSAEQKRVYKNLKTELLAQYDGHELTIQNKIALTLRLMQVTGGFFPYMREEEYIKGSEHFMMNVGDSILIGQANVKLEALRDDLGEVEQGTKMIVWAAFVSELKYIYKELSKDYKCCLYYGGTSDNDRKQIVADFKEGKYDIFIGNVATAGFGLNLQIASLQYFFSNSFMVEARLQAEDRSHRIGMKGSAVYKDIIVKGTIDEKIYENIVQGRDLNDFFKASSIEDIFAIDEESEDANG